MTENDDRFTGFKTIKNLPTGDRRGPNPDDYEDVSLMIGIGTGASGQFLIQTEHGTWGIIDTISHQRINLSNPRGLLCVLEEQLNRE